MSYKKIPFPLLLFIPFFIACSGSKEQASEDPQEGKESEERTEAGTDQKSDDGSEAKEMEARVKDFTHLDGCRYLLIGPKDKKYHPLNLDTAYFEDGLKVQVQYRKKDAITTCMSGTTIHILDIKARD
jgi:hypothetical protein